MPRLFFYSRTQLKLIFAQCFTGNQLDLEKLTELAGKTGVEAHREEFYFLLFSGPSESIIEI
jgi:hypothetical protein